MNEALLTEGFTVGIVDGLPPEGETVFNVGETVVGLEVGVAVDFDGVTVGQRELGLADGKKVDFLVGTALGTIVSFNEGIFVVSFDGSIVGHFEGEQEGDPVSFDVGLQEVGFILGVLVGVL
jgi:hypothetical protein